MAGKQGTTTVVPRGMVGYPVPYPHTGFSENGMILPEACEKRTTIKAVRFLCCWAISYPNGMFQKNHIPHNPQLHVHA